MDNILAQWQKGLSKTSQAAFGRLAGLFGVSEINADLWDTLEAQLVQADLGIDTTISVSDALKESVREKGLTKASDLWDLLREELRSRLDNSPAVEFTHVPTVILMIGVNGSGKTTTIAKLGHRFLSQGKSVLFGAADTFRAAAVDQLQVWGDRLGVDVITGQPESDPGAVAYNTVQAAAARKVDVVLVDTAGRLHTRFNLMEELKKVHRVIGKALPGAPHEVWLVVDAATGQNALRQARSFRDLIGVTGVILSKLDSSARGGMTFAIRQELELPILFAGLGEKLEDLQPFDPDAFIDGIMYKE